MRRKTDDTQARNPRDRCDRHQPASRGLRLREGIALGLLALVMAGAWVVTLTG